MQLAPCHYEFAAQLEEDHNAAYGKGVGTRLAQRYLGTIAGLSPQKIKTGRTRERSLTEETILKALAKKPCSKKELAKITCRSIGLIGNLCQRLEKQGYIKSKAKVEAGFKANLYSLAK